MIHRQPSYTPWTSGAEQRGGRKTYGQELSDSHLLRLLAAVHIGEGSQFHGGRASRHEHEAEPEHGVLRQPVGFGRNGVDD